MAEVDVAEYVKGKPLVCDHLAKKNAQAPVSFKSKENRKYSFDLDKADLIFDWLLDNKRIRCKGNRKVPLTEELRGKKFCKCHSSLSH